METSTILAIIAFILLVIHWKGPNAVWGGATLGAIIGLIISLVTGEWNRLAIAFSIGTFAGTIIEWVWRVSKRKQRGIY